MQGRCRDRLQEKRLRKKLYKGVDILPPSVQDLDEMSFGRVWRLALRSAKCPPPRPSRPQQPSPGCWHASFPTLPPTLRRRRHVDCGIASTSRLPPVPATPRLSATGPIAQLVRAVDSSTQWCAVAEKRQMNGMNSGEPSVRVGGHGNPEPSRRYTVGRCRDYLRAGGAVPRRAPLMTGLSVPRPTRSCAVRAVAAKGGEIVRARWKHRGHVNPLVPGSSPGGPTKMDMRQRCSRRTLCETIGP